MDSLLTFFSNLILITAGLAVSVLWLIIFAVVGETILEVFQKGDPEDFDDYPENEIR